MEIYRIVNLTSPLVGQSNASHHKLILMHMCKTVLVDASVWVGHGGVGQSWA